MSYLPIGDYAAIGDLHTAALVGRNGSIDWLCPGRFDSPSVFAALLDAARGGRCRVAPVLTASSEQRYLPATNVLETSFHVEGGVLQLTDFMPVGPARTMGTEVHRIAHCPRGEVEVEVTFAPRFAYASRRTTLAHRRDGILASDAERDVASISAPSGLTWEIVGATATARTRLKAGERLILVLRFDDDEVRPLETLGTDWKLERTAQWWDEWVSQGRFEGPYRNELLRSALALKLCCYEPTGAVVAAPTTSLPEAPGGERNWDYRYAWLRDSAFVTAALHHLGFGADAAAFLGFLKRVCRLEREDHLQIMYGVDGGRELPERELPHLEGYDGAGPVRIGNGAVGQFQLDIYGELLETVDIFRHSQPITEGLWKVARGLVDWTAAHWREPDWSIWEPRIAPKHHVFSKVLAWSALTRGANIAEELGLPGDSTRWRDEAAAIREEVTRRGWDPVRQTFVQAYDEPQLDAALLVIPKVGFLPPDDPRVRSTLEAVRRELASPCEDLIYRYRNADGLLGDEGAFLFTSFWMVQVLALTGEIEEAERLFGLLLRRTNHVGLLAEEIDPATGAQLGNFPQALSHAALINTVFVLERAAQGGSEGSA